MGGSLGYRLIAILSCLCALSGAAWGEYPERTGNTDILYVNDPRIELSLRRYLVENAQHSVDIAVLAQGLDAASFPVVDALRGASQRGLPVRFMHDDASSKILGDLAGHLPGALADSGLTRPAEVVRLTNSQKQAMGLHNNDFFHEKMFIIDRGTPNETIIIAGGNQSPFDLASADSAIIIRPIDPSKPYLGTDVRDYFERTWGFLSEHSPPVPPKPLANSTRQRMAGLSTELIETPGQRQHFEQLVELLQRKPVEGESLAPFQFRPERTQFFANEVVRAASEEGRPKDFRSRLTFSNPITEALAGHVQGARQVDFVNYVWNPPPALRRAVRRNLAENPESQMRFWTNGREAHGAIYTAFAPLGWVANQSGITPSVLDLSLVELVPLMERFGDRVGINLYDLRRVGEQPAPQNQARYQHTKAAIVDNTVFQGSDNFTESAATRNNEIVVAVTDPRYASFLRSLYAHSPLHTPLSLPEAWDLFRRRPMASDACRELFREIY